MRVRAATAYKEYAHIPSIAEKLTKAGLLQHKTIQDNANNIVKKNKIPVIHSVELDNGYYPKTETIQKLKGIKNITAPKNKSLQGKIVLNKRQIHNLFGGLGGTKYNIMDLRDNNSKEHFINQFLTKHTNKRVTSKQWKALIRKVSNIK